MMKPTEQTVGTTSEKVAALRGRTRAPAWEATTTYPQGAVVKANFNYYMAVVGGDSGATAPIHGPGEATDGTVTWRYVSKAKRRGLTIQNNGANDVYISVGYPAVALAGQRLLPGGSSSFHKEEEVQQAFHAVAAAGTCSLSILEW